MPSAADARKDKVVNKALCCRCIMSVAAMIIRLPNLYSRFIVTLWSLITYLSFLLFIISARKNLIVLVFR